MFILDTIAHETIWGGIRFKEVTDSQLSKIGHLYSVYCRENKSNLVLNGKYAGKQYNEVFNSIKKRYHMDEYRLFPLTIALVDAENNLSIQVHPDEESAKELEGVNAGKRESWYFFSTPKEGYIFNGSRCVTKEEILQKIESDAMEDIIDHLKIKKGDYVFVEPGTLHAMSSGSYVYEIEEGSDYTYRFFDFHRKDDAGNERELHIDKAVYALKPNLKSVPYKYQPDEEIVEKTYATLYMQNLTRYRNESDDLECLTIIKGSFKLDNVWVKSGMTIILEPEDEVEDIFAEEVIRAKLIRKEEV